MDIPSVQSYPPPTPLPPMRAGETDGRYMDCTPALAPVADVFVNITTLSVIVTRADGAALTANDLQQDMAVPAQLDPTGMIPTFWWIAPPANTGTDYILTLSTAPNLTREGRVFIRDWMMSIVPLLG